MGVHVSKIYDISAHLSEVEFTIKVKASLMRAGDLSSWSEKSFVAISAYAFEGADGAFLKYKKGADAASAPWKVYGCFMRSHPASMPP